MIKTDIKKATKINDALANLFKLYEKNEDCSLFTLESHLKDGVGTSLSLTLADLRFTRRMWNNNSTIKYTVSVMTNQNPGEWETDNRAENVLTLKVHKDESNV